MTGRALDILLVEDNPGDARLVREMLADATDRTRDGEAGPAFTHVDRLADALEHLEAGGVDVVLLDLGLPDSAGLETLETVREHAREVPIVVLTGLADETVGDRAVQEGAQEYLVKDELTPPLLRRSLRHAMDRKRFERTQTALHGASRELIGAESREEVARLAVDAAVEALDLRGIGIFLFDDSTNRLEPAAYTDPVEALFGEVPSFGPEAPSITWGAFIRGETVAHDDVRDAGAEAPEDALLRSGVWIPLGDHGVLAIVAETVDAVDQRTQQLADHLAATVEATLDRVEREESLREHERELAERNRQLEELNRTNELIREIDQALVRAKTRSGIEEAVCDLLTASDRYAFAWIGEPTGDGGVEPRTWRGDGRGYLEAVPLRADGDGQGGGVAAGEGEPPPAAATVADGTATLTPNVAQDLRRGAWRKAALARDLQSVVSVPLSYDEMSYGVLTVFAAEPGAFDARSAEVFEELGETIANAVNAVETRRALLTDTVVELELSIPASEDLLGQLASEAGCDVEYGGAVPQSGGTTHLYFGARECDVDTVRRVAESLPDVQRVDVISEADEAGGEHRFEAAVTGATVPLSVVESGAVVGSLRVSGDDLRVVVELPETTDVRTFVDRLEATYPGTELVARRDRERSGDARSLEAELGEHLTDRQLEALQTAFFSGYFEWPRERTGEEVAESLGITQPTFNAHLRSAERKLCAALFGGDPPAG